MYDNTNDYYIIPVDRSWLIDNNITINSEVSIKDINNKAVAWIYNGKDAIHAGINPYDFIEKLKTF